MPGLFPEAGTLVDNDGTVHLLGDFIPWPESDRLFDAVMSEVAWEQAELVMFGRKVREPRLGAWHSVDGSAYTYSGSARRSNPVTPTLSALLDRVSDHTGAAFNSVLANLYRDGQDHLGWHADNEACNGPEPTIASVSLGAERYFDLRHRTSGERCRVLLPHGSLLVMSGALQRHWVHRVPRMTRVAAPRVNLTFRLVS